MKRRLLIIAIFLLAGAVVNVAVAWLVALSGRPTAGPGSTITENAEAEAVWGRYAKEEWPPAPVEFGLTKERGQGWEAAIATVATRIRRFAWSCDFLQVLRTLSEGPEIRDTGRVNVARVTVRDWHVIEVRSGWPVRCLRGAKYQGGTGAAMATDRVLVVTVGTIPTFTTAPPIPDERLIPYGPLWGGLVMNTVLYAAVLYGAWLAYVFARRVFRYEDGRCPICGYDLREKGQLRVLYMLARGCPECGWRREAKGAEKP